MLLSKYNARDIEFALCEETSALPFPPASDRAAWEQVCATIGDQEFDLIIAQAEADSTSEIAPLPATLYLDFKRTGERPGYEMPMWHRRQMLESFVLAECLEYQGRFLDPLLNIIWAICEESSWAYPAHQAELTDMHNPFIDLMAAMTGLQLAEAHSLLADALDPAVSKRIRYEVDRRLLTPYLTSHEFWWLYNTQKREVNNWNAVCNGGVVGAALYLETDMARLAEIIAKGARSLDDYLDTFDSDGGSTEGPGYWSFGFGNYVVLAHLVEQRTNGRISFLNSEHIQNISQFPLRTMLSVDRFVNFSDCDPHIQFTASLLAYLSNRYQMPDLMKLALRQPHKQISKKRDMLTWSLRDLFWQVDPSLSDQTYTPAEHDWYSGMMWMIARYNPADPNALVLAAKGGHNGEMHNQNDVGNLIVHLNGESVIADVGRGRYTKAYFGPERYQHFVNQSFGHSLPVPNGQQQQPSSYDRMQQSEQERAYKDYTARLLDHRADDAVDLLSLELKALYPAQADLASLKRTIMLHRQSPYGWVEVIDEVVFATEAGSFESVLITFGEVEIAVGAVLLRGEKSVLTVEYDTAVVTPRVELIKDVDLAVGPADVRRVIFAFMQPQQSGKIRLRIVPG